MSIVDEVRRFVDSYLDRPESFSARDVTIAFLEAERARGAHVEREVIEPLVRAYLRELFPEPEEIASRDPALGIAMGLALESEWRREHPEEPLPPNSN